MTEPATIFSFAGKSQNRACAMNQEKRPNPGAGQRALPFSAQPCSMQASARDFAPPNLWLRASGSRPAP